MPRRDEEKRIAFLRTLATEDLANRRITEHSSEVEKRMVHDARDLMKEKNDERYMTRHKKKAVVDAVKTQVNNVGRRVQSEFFGREGGITGGMVGSWLVGGTLVGGTIVGSMASKGKLGRALLGGKAIGRHTRGRINFLNRSHLSGKDTDALINIVKRAKKGSLSPDDRIWLQKKAVFYKNREGSALPFAKKGNSKTDSMRGNPPKKAPLGQGEPVKSNMPPTQSNQNVGNPKRTNPNTAAMGQTQKDALSKLEAGQRLKKEDYVVLRQLKTEGKLSQTQQSLLSARQRLAKSRRIVRTEQPQSAAAPPATTPAIEASKPAMTTKYSDADLKTILSKGGKLPEGFPAYPNTVRQLRESSKRPDLSFNNDVDYAKQIEDFAREIAEVAKRSPQADQENVCLWLSHKVAQVNRPIENLGRSLYDKSKTMLQGSGEIKKKVNP